MWQKINSLKPRKQRQTVNYRHDENIIVSEPTDLRQIMVPSAGEIEYVTDNGLIIPSITLNLHRQLIGAADRLGISWERRVCKIKIKKNIQYFLLNEININIR